MIIVPEWLCFVIVFVIGGLVGYCVNDIMHGDPHDLLDHDFDGKDVKRND